MHRPEAVAGLVLTETAIMNAKVKTEFAKAPTDLCDGRFILAVRVGSDTCIQSAQMRHGAGPFFKLSTIMLAQLFSLPVTECPEAMNCTHAFCLTHRK